MADKLKGTYTTAPERRYVERAKHSASGKDIDNDFQEKLIEGDNITITEDNVISAVGGTEVIANPELSDTDPALTGLQVGENKYKVDGGTELYTHWIRGYAKTDDWNYANFSLIITSAESEKYTNFDDIASFLRNKTSSTSYPWMRNYQDWTDKPSR